MPQLLLHVHFEVYYAKKPSKTATRKNKPPTKNVLNTPN